MIESIDELRARASATRLVEIKPEDRREFARALVLQGYDTPRAHRLAYDECGAIQDNDGALQMLARHRVAHTSPQSVAGETIVTPCDKAQHCCCCEAGDECCDCGIIIQPDWVNAGTCIENAEVAYDDSIEDADGPVDTVIFSGDLGVLISLARFAVAQKERAR